MNGKSRPAGFTLIETLVALAIVGLALAAIAGVFSNALMGHETASGAETALALADQVLRLEPNDATAKLLADAIGKIGIERLPWSNALKQWRDRVMFLRAS